MPCLEKTSFLFNILEKNRNFAHQIGKINYHVTTASNHNRAKINFLQMQWEEQREKLVYAYIVKNKKKKEYSTLIGQLTDIPNLARDKLLKHYLAHCRLNYALTFFQWRYLKFKDSDPQQAENNKEIFYHRIEALMNHM